MSTADNNTVRRLIYGASTGAGSLSTADIAWFVANNSNIYLAASEAADAEALAKSAKGDKTVGDLSISYGGSAALFLSLATKLRLRGVRTASAHSGGISVSDKENNRTDSDWDQPAARSGQFDYDNDGSYGGSS